MIIKSKYRRFLGYVIVAILLVSFFLTPLLNLARARSDDWWDTYWPYRKTISINQTKVGGVLENFPLLINITDSDLAKAQQDGDDIVFVDANTGMKLNHEIEYFDHDAGHLVAWVSVPLLVNTSDTKLFMHYGNRMSENQQNPTVVWDTDFLMVQHFEENSGTRYDSSGNSNNGTPYGGVVKSASEKIDGADCFDGIDDKIKQTSLSLLNKSEIMIESWIYVYSVPAVARYARTHMYGRNLPSPLWRYGLWIALPNHSPIYSFTLQVRLYNPETGTQSFPYPVSLVDQWVHVAWGLSKSTNRTYFYVNGVLVKSDDISTLLTTGFITPLDDPEVKGFSIGSSILWGECTKMMSDEVRISNIVRSASWILTSYNNQKDPFSFYTLDEEEKVPQVPPFIYDENPQTGATDVYTNPTLSIRATDVDGDLITVIFGTNATGTWQDAQSYINVGEGTYTWTPTVMDKLATKYFWSVSVTDGNSWTNKTYSFTTIPTYLAQKWKTWGVPRASTGVLIADVVGDSQEEVIHAGVGGVVVLNGTDGRVIWSVPVEGVTAAAQTEIADLNRDGILEIVVTIKEPAGLHVLHANNGSTYWRRTDLGGYLSADPVIADIDGNGYPTIFAASMWKLPNGFSSTGRLTSLTYDGQILHQTSLWHPCAGGLSIAYTDNDGDFELFVGDRHMYFERDQGHGKGVRSFWAKNLTLRWEYPDIICSSHRPMLADVNRDGILDVVVGSHRGGLAVLNSEDGSAIKKTLNIPGDAPIHYQPSIYDIDGDGNLELLMADGEHDSTANDIVVWDLVKWEVDARIPVRAGKYGPQIADVTGDGYMDIIITNDTDIFVYDRNYTLVGQVKGVVKRLMYAVVQDIDGDGYNEVVVANENGGIYAFDTPARRLTPRPRTEVRFYSERRLGVAEYVPPLGPPAPVISAPFPSDGATNVPITLSQLSFSLTDFQCNLMNYTVMTSPNIGSDIASNVRNEKYTVTISNLEYGTTYTWFVSVTDGTNWTNETFILTTESISPWWNARWQYRKTITIDPTRVSSDQTDFPVLINLIDSNLTGKAQPEGDDFVFTDANQNKLSHQIELYNSTTGQLVAWVNMPFVSSTTYAKLYLYYGNPNAINQQNVTAVWDSSFKMMLHLDEETGPHYDSTINSNNGTAYGGVRQGVTGKIDGADSFDGVNDYIEVAHSDSVTGFTEAFSVSFWLKLEDTDRRQTILNKYSTIGNQRAWFIEFRIYATYGKVLAFFISPDGASFRKYLASFDPTAGEWYYVTIVWESGKVAKFYINGTQVPTIGKDTISSIFNNTGVPLSIGRSIYATNRYLKGGLDEIRISNMARSADWILTSYKNQEDPASFYTVSMEEALPEEPVLTAPSPFDEATNVPASLSQLSFNIMDYQGDFMNYTVVTHPDVGSGNATNVGNGTYTISISNLTRSTMYTWLVSVTDGTNWTNKTYSFTTESEPFWWNTDWQYRKTLAIDPIKISSDQISFPVLMELTDSDLANRTQPDGDDIVFTDYNNVQLNHEIEQYNGSSGQLIAWVNVPFLSSTTYTRFYLYYGNPNAINQQNVTAVWDSSFKMVLHLDEKNGSHYDSTVNGNNGTSYGGVTQGFAGKIDGADSFDGVDDFIEVPHSDSITGFTTAFSVSFWLKLEDTDRRQTILNKYNIIGNQRAWFIEFQIDNTYGKVLGFFISPDGPSFRKYLASFDPTAGEWYYVTIVWESGKVAKFYINGTQVPTIGTRKISSIFNNTGVPLSIGRSIYATNRYLKGGLDEIRISNMARSADWILTSYKNQRDGAYFHEIGSEQKLPESPIISAPSPLNSATRVTIPLNQLSFNLIDYQGDMMNYAIVTYPDIGSIIGLNVLDGRYAVSVSNLSPSTTYTWIVNVTDGIHWTNQTYTFTTYPGATPTHEKPLLISSGGTNKTDENLICYNQTTYDLDNDKVTNVYNWYINNTSITNLLLPFDTNTSSITKDYSSHEHDGIIVRDVTWTSDGKVGGAFEFNGGYIQVPSKSTLDGGGEWLEITVEQWIYIITYRSSTRTIAKIPSYEIGLSWNKIYVGIWIDTGVWNVSSYNRVRCDTVLEKNTWYHVAFTYKNGTGLTLYINGIAVATESVSGYIQSSGSEPLDIGWFDYFKGKIDEVRIYQKSLSPQQIYQRYLETKDGLSNSSTIVPEETEVGDIWKCQVTPNDSYPDGLAKFSNTITIVENNLTAHNLTTTSPTYINEFGSQTVKKGHTSTRTQQCTSHSIQLNNKKVTSGTSQLDQATEKNTELARAPLFLCEYGLAWLYSLFSARAITAYPPNRLT